MLNIKAGVMFVLALLLGTGAAVMAYGWIQQNPQAQAEGDPEFALVYVAAREIPYGKTLDKSLIKTVEWPVDRVPKGAVLADEDPIGKVITQELLPGEVLMSARVSDKLPGSRLSSIVQPKMRAITVRVNDVAGVAGFLLPGNRVDVLATRMQDRRAITSTLLENIRVLAVDQKASSAKDEPIVVRAVTLEVLIEQASMLASATEEGSIQLVLRNPDDQSTQASTAEELLLAQKAAEEANQATAAATSKPPKARKPNYSLTIIRGTEVARRTLRQ